MIRQHLIALRALLSDPKRWTQGAMARDAKGALCCPLAPTALCWCIRGGIELVTSSAWQLSCYLDNLVSRPATLVSFNDTHTHADVLALIDRALASLPADSAPPA